MSIRSGVDADRVDVEVHEEWTRVVHAPVPAVGGRIAVRDVAVLPEELTGGDSAADRNLPGRADRPASLRGKGVRAAALDHDLAAGDPTWSLRTDRAGRPLRPRVARVALRPLKPLRALGTGLALLALLAGVALRALRAGRAVEAARARLVPVQGRLVVRALPERRVDDAQDPGLLVAAVDHALAVRNRGVRRAGDDSERECRHHRNESLRVHCFLLLARSGLRARPRCRGGSEPAPKRR